MACSNCSGCIALECDYGLYGSSCSLTCSAFCRNKHCVACTCATCNVTSGYCLYGCKEGWHGKLCQKKCPVNCSEQNITVKKCKQNNGICVNGCVDGFFGFMCDDPCDVKCVNMTCNQTTGHCLTECVHRLNGTQCNVEVGTSEGDHVAGALGGAFVITLWGFIVVALIYFIRRRRLKEYEPFKRNRSHGSGRGSSRRHLHRQSSCSSLNLTTPNQDTEECFEFTVPENGQHSSYCEARRTYFTRSFSDEQPVFHICTHPNEMDPRSTFNEAYNLPGGSNDFPSQNDDFRVARYLIRTVTVDNETGDSNEMTEIRNARGHLPRHTS